MIFDQYSRYKACSDLLGLAGIAPNSSVLDIGSGPECLFGQFMPDAAMNYVDPLIPVDSGQGHITGNIFASELDGQTFDCVSAVDVLEHVPPEHRQAFLERMSSLGRNTLILGFPTSDSSDAVETDQAIDDQYRAIFGHNYSWLEEHYRYGLPSLAETVEQLSRSGWHCQTVGHGHAPWLRELLGFVICAWDIPGLNHVVLEISEKFNRELYPYDFRPPYYRQFVIASRHPLPKIIAPGTGHDDMEAAEGVFRALMEEAKQKYFAASASQLATAETNHGKAIVALNAKIEEASAWGKTLHGKLAERDAQVQELNAKIEEVVARMQQELMQWRDKAVEISDWAVRLQDEMVRISEWAARIDRSPIAHAVKKYAFGFLRAVYRAIPLSADGKQRLRNGIKQLVRPLMASYAPGAAAVTLTPSQVQSIVAAGSITGQVKPRDVFVFSVIDWHFRIQRPQQLARGLAKSGRRVFYFSNNFVDASEPGYQIERLDPLLQLYQISLHVKGAPAIYFAPPTEETEMMLQASIVKVILDFASLSTDSIIQHAYWYTLVKRLPNNFRIYDCMDHHEGFGHVPEKLIEIEKEMLRETDLVVVTSCWLENFARDFNSNIAVIRNATEYQHFSNRPTEIYVDPQGRRIIGYYGAIAEWFDIGLIRAVALANPAHLILLVGNDTVNADAALADLPNVALTGEVPYAQLPFYLYAFELCLLPFKVTSLTLATNPVKIYEYLSAGKLTISVDLPEIAQFGDLVLRAKSESEFVDLVTQNMRGGTSSTESVQSRKSYAAQQTWGHRVSELMSILDCVNMPKISVIVLTYNNLDLTKACLQSLIERSDYPNLEIIVVDNASGDGTPAFLDEFGQAHTAAKVILNEDNIGFAAGNNIGLAAATGDYLVLLNNDTVVTRGWAMTLMRHLQADLSIGLIGSVTNNIGNEARIGMAYTDISDMPVESLQYTLNNMGRLLPIRNVAFFCAMMPRSTYERCGPLCEEYGLGFFEDDDYCRRVEVIGLRIVCAEDVFVHHHLSASFNKLKSEKREALMARNKAIYEEKWGVWIPHTYRNQ